MKAFHAWTFAVVLLSLATLGCTNNAPPQESSQVTQVRIKANLEKLNSEDRELALEQKYCAVESKNLLGSMGVPVKVMIADEPVFLCCDGCAKAAKKDPKKTLARVENLKVQTALARLDPADRKLAEEQKFCATDPKSRLGSMGTPVKLMVKDQPVFICCAGCRKAALKDADKTLAAVKKLKAASTSAAKEPSEETHE